MIPHSVQALPAHRQFIVYRAALKAGGKTDKIPVDYRTKKTANAHDPLIWTDRDTASATAAAFGSEYGIGFVFTEADPYWFLDIDNCLIDGQWSQLAMQLCSMLIGCYIEVSQSGRGLHIFGRGTIPQHGCTNKSLGLEFYHSGRFVALTGVNALGSWEHDASAVLPVLVATYFPSNTGGAVDRDWTDGPCEEWNGPKDDAELIRRAMQSKSPASVFGERASFADLWDANGPVLARAYPDSKGLDYNDSSADMALAQHLAYWTGKDCERIRRLMEGSALVRPKWQRKDYLPRTIRTAVARQNDVLRDKPHEDEAARRRKQIEESMRIGDGADEIPVVGTMPLEEMLARFVFIQDGQQVVDLQRPRYVSALADWKAAYKASTVTIEVKGQFNSNGTAKLKTYDAATVWEKSPARKQAFGVTFKAGGNLFMRDPKGADAVNIWSPFDRSASPGDASLFLEHVEYLFGEAAGSFLDWLAHIEQKPWELPHSGHVHISDQHGTGRNWIAGVIARIWPGYAAINFDLSGTLRTGFNDRLSCKLIAVVDEIQEGGSNAKWDNAETMKRIVTEEFRTINQKYGRIREEFNACRWLIFSNHISALPLDEHDRRFNVVRNEESPRAPEYYGRLYAALKDRAFIAGVAQLLQKRDLSGFNPGAHAVMNEAKEAVVAASRSDADEILNDLVKHWPVDVIHTSSLGELITGHPGGRLTRGHDHALERRGIRRYAKKIRAGETSIRVSILRNFQHWKNADAGQIRAELERAPKIPFAGVRAYLDRLAAE